jgi:ferredoxin
MSHRLDITIAYDRCVGSSICTLLAPRTFSLNEDRQAMVVNAQGEAEETILQAAEGCPMMAITVTDADTGECLFQPQ